MIWGYFSAKFAQITIVFLNICASVLANAQRNIEYGSMSAHRADIYRPDDGDAHPVVVFFYGGGWRGGSKEGVAYIGAALARKGFVVVIPEYRHFPTVGLADILSDNAAAVAWTLNHVSEYGGDPQKVVVAGHSSGAWAAAMLALDPKWLDKVGFKPSDMAGIIAMSGPYSVSALTEQADKEVFAGAEPDMEPINDCSPRRPAMLLLAGALDTDVLPFSTMAFSTRLREFGNAVETHVYPGLGHDHVIHALSFPFLTHSPVSDAFKRFVMDINRLKVTRVSN